MTLLARPGAQSTADASYLLVSNDARLPNSRALAGTVGQIDVADTGAGGAYTLSLNSAITGALVSGGAANRVAYYSGATTLTSTANFEYGTAGTNVLSIPGGLAVGSASLTSGYDVDLRSSTAGNGLRFAQAAASSGTPNGFLYVGGTHTGLADAVEYTTENHDYSSTITWGGNSAVAVERVVRIQAPTLAQSAGGTKTFSTVATLAVSGAPAAGTGVAITSPVAIWIDGSSSSGVNQVIRIDNYGVTSTVQPVFATRAARGTFASPTGVQAGDVIGRVSFLGLNSSGSYNTAASIAGVASETFTGTATGAYWAFQAVNTGAVGLTEYLRVGPSQLWASAPITVGRALGTPAPSTNYMFDGYYSGSSCVVSMEAQSDTALDTPAVVFRRARLSGAAVQNGDRIMALAVYGSSGSSTYPSTASVAITSYATETHTGSAAGSNIRFETTRTGTASSTRTERFRIHDDGDGSFVGDFVIGSAVGTNPTATLDVVQAAVASGTPNPALRITGGAHTGLADADVNNLLSTPGNISFGTNTTFSSGLSAHYFRSQTISQSAGGSKTVQFARTVFIEGPPTAGTGVTLSIPTALTIGGSGNAIWSGGGIGLTAGSIRLQAGTIDWANTYVPSATPMVARLYHASNSGGGSIGMIYMDRAARTTTPWTPAVTFIEGAHTSMTASTEYISFNFNSSATLQWATGALTTQRTFLIQAPTLSFVGSSTVTTAATLAITGAPTAGTNATITRSWALLIQAGNQAIAGSLIVGSTSASPTYTGDIQGSLGATRVATTGSPVSTFAAIEAAHTSLTTTSEYISYNFNSSATVQWATGNKTTQRTFLVQAPTLAAVGTSTTTDAATVAITGAPIAGTNMTITNSYALWVQSGTARFDGTVIISNQQADLPPMFMLMGA